MGPSSQGANHFFLGRTSLRAKTELVGPSSQGAIHFFVKYGGPSGGSPLSGGGIIILRVIWRHFLAAAVDPVIRLQRIYNFLLLHAILYSVLDD